MPDLKVTADHLRRDAYLYIRQSTLRQVAENGESTQRQYGLRHRAIAAGWPAERIHVIDCDLGKSGSSAVARDGFQELVSEVALAKAGIVMGLEVSRLARNSADWHRLLELCALTSTLILDEDGIYDSSFPFFFLLLLLPSPSFPPPLPRLLFVVAVPACASAPVAPSLSCPLAVSLALWPFGAAFSRAAGARAFARLALCFPPRPAVPSRPPRVLCRAALWPSFSRRVARGLCSRRPLLLAARSAAAAPGARARGLRARARWPCRAPAGSAAGAARAGGGRA